MKEYEKQDLESFIEKDIFDKYQKYKAIKKKPKKSTIWIIFVFAILLGLVTILFKTEVIYLWIFNELIFFGLIIADIGLVVALICLIFNYFSQKRRYEIGFINTLETDKYYYIALSNLTGGYVDQLVIRGNFLKTYFNVKPFIKGAHRISVNDVLSFVLEGQLFCYGVVMSSTRYPGTKKSGDIYVPHYQTFIVGDFIKKFIEYPAQMFFKTGPFFKSKKTEKIELESKEFNEYANLYADDQIEIRKFFTPKKISGVLDIKDEPDQAKLKYLFMGRNGILGEVINHRAMHLNQHSFKDFSMKKTPKELAEQINAKVLKETRDLFDILRFIQRLELFPEQEDSQKVT
ncbi:DUF3137 domain-containing protein [Spiroplasma alleghenense]|uniref:DUF3137 domain-containing protein n=1 Tax=Spiroplasma alleghenense TaxID=216931 RepID=A0A345Z317_9MOLU|nr:DUF3137 domain-containing protein [Spiroplasma alleghenense]AXK50996.1 hypothetical protein SALLE_v1c03220 [Spiroplasma alleghenense]